uniref:C2-C2_1 domain-containing protein n=1 Tax=Macrostomum lignano TaxID=282301 RepID=A0A1I8JP90_9PLAT
MLNCLGFVLKKTTSWLGSFAQCKSPRAGCRPRDSQLQRAAHDAESQVSGLSKARSSLQAQLEEMKKTLDEESRTNSDIIHRKVKRYLSSFMTPAAGSITICSPNTTKKVKRRASLRVQINKLNSELTTLRSKYERDFVSRVEEFEEVKRKLTVKVTELEDVAERERSRANNMDRSRQQLLAELKALQGDTTTRYRLAYAANAELASQVKQSEATVRIEELTSESASLQATLAVSTSRAGQAAQIVEIGRRPHRPAGAGQCPAGRQPQGGQLGQSRPDQIARLPTPTRQSPRSARNSFASSLRRAREAVRELTQKQAATADALARLRSDLETRLAEKESELESLRRSSQRTVEELQAALNDSDAKHKSEVNRLKKHLESTKPGQGEQDPADAHFRELEALLEDERRANESELNELRDNLRDRRARAGRRPNPSCRTSAFAISELTMQLQTSGNERRRLEGELASLRSELEDAQSGRLPNWTGRNRLAGEVQRLAERVAGRAGELPGGRGAAAPAGESESLASRESKRIAAATAGASPELEAELEAEQRRAREFRRSLRKMERQVKEALAQAEEERLVNIELHDLLGKAQLKIKAYKRQVEESRQERSVAKFNRKANTIRCQEFRVQRQESDNIRCQEFPCQRQESEQQRRPRLRPSASTAKRQQVAEEARAPSRSGRAHNVGAQGAACGGTVIRSISVTREMNSSQLVRAQAEQPGFQCLFELAR